jgi:hypothetical protein
MTGVLVAKAWSLHSRFGAALTAAPRTSPCSPSPLESCTSET